MLALPDPNTFELLPWRRPTTRPSPACSATSRTSTATPFEGDPRYVLKRNLERAREKGFTFFVAPEMEFFYFAVGDPTSRRSRSTPPAYFDLTTARPRLRDLRKQTILTLEAMGIPVEYSFHEDGPSQHEIDLRYTDALTMADNVMTFRLVVQGGRARARRATPRSCRSRSTARSGLGHAHAPLAVRGRRQRVPRSRRRVRPVEGRPSTSSPACCATRARSPRSPTSWSTPTSG